MYNAILLLLLLILPDPEHGAHGVATERDQ